MRVRCGHCQHVFAVASISPQGDQFPCPKCGSMMLVRAPQSQVSRPVPLPPVPVVRPQPTRPQVIEEDDVIDLNQPTVIPAQPVRQVTSGKPIPAASSPQYSAPSPQPIHRQPAASASEEQPHHPRKKKKKKAHKSNLPLIIGGSIAIAVIVVAVVIITTVLNKEDNRQNFAQNQFRRDNQPSHNTSRISEEANEARPTPKRNPVSSDNGESTGNRSSSNDQPATEETADRSSQASKSKPDSSDIFNTVQPPSFSGNSDGSGGTDVYPYVLKSSTFILAVTKDGRNIGAGSGSLIDVKNRLVLTNDHVAGDSDKIAVFFPTYDKNGKLIAEKRKFTEQFDKKNFRDIIEAKVIATNPTIDLCILQLPRLPAGVEALPISKQSCRVGQRVHSIGNPGSSGALWVYAPGVVRQTYRTTWRTLNDDRSTNTHTADVIETQSPTNHGDSGGPLVNDRGELVGVTHGGRADGLSSISIFIDVSEVKKFVDESVQRYLKTVFVPESRAPLNAGGVAASAPTSGMTGSLPDLVKALQNTETRAKAAEALGAMGEKARDAIPSLMKLLVDQDEFVRRTAMTALTKIGNPSKGDLPMMITALGDPNVEMRRYAAATLEKMGSEARSVSSEMIAALRDTDPLVRQSVARALGSFGRDVKDRAKAPLEEMLKDSDKDNCIAAADGLANIFAASNDHEGIQRLLKHQDAEVRVCALKASAKLGRNAKPILGELLTMAKDDTGETRKAVISILGQLDPADARQGLNLLLEAAKNGDKETRLAALSTLGNLSKEVQPAMVAAVKECMKDSELKLACVETLKKFVPNSKASLTLLVELVKEDDGPVAEAATKAIIDLGPAATGAVAELIKLMDISGNVVTRDDEERVNKYANLLAKIGKTAIPTLRRGLASRSITRWGCVKALGEIGPPAREAVRDLQLLMNQEPNEFIRRDIQEAIGKILNQ